jgi:hypothetical protein
MICEVFQNRIADYLDGALDHGSSARFGAHALQCRSCRSLLDDVKSKLRDDSPPEIETIPGLDASLEMILRPGSPFECARFEENITEFLDGYVPARVYQKFAAHSAECDACSQLLTDVVYAVAACHSVHTYEEVDVAAPLERRLMMIAEANRPGQHPSLIANTLIAAARSLAVRFGPVALRLVPGYTLVRSRLAGGLVLAGAASAIFLATFSDDPTPAGVYRRAQEKAGNVYLQGVSQKKEVTAEVERLGSDVTQILATFDREGRRQADTSTADTAPAQGQREKPVKTEDNNRTNK